MRVVFCYYLGFQLLPNCIQFTQIVFFTIWLNLNHLQHFYKNFQFPVITNNGYLLNDSICLLNLKFLKKFFLNLFGFPAIINNIPSVSLFIFLLFSKILCITELDCLRFLL